MDRSSPAPARPLSFRLMTRTDLALMKRWLSMDHVRRTEWAEHSPAEVDRDFGSSVDGSDPTRVTLVSEGGRPIGMIQDYLIGDYPDWAEEIWMIDDVYECIGIDYLIGEPEAIGRGIGSQMIARHLATLWDVYPGAPGAVTGAMVDNGPSWRALERCGFDRVWEGVLPEDRDSGDVCVMYRLDRPKDLD